MFFLDVKNLLNFEQNDECLIDNVRKKLKNNNHFKSEKIMTLDIMMRVL